jgi:4-amino-4-deoxychorismate lyase
VRRCELRLALQPRLAGAKHLNRLENVIARMEWLDHRVAEGLLLDTEGYVIEGIAANLFIARNGSLLTPDLSRCGVSGVTRERIIDAAVRHGVPIRVAAITWDDLLGAEEAMLVNSLIGVWPVRALVDRAWTSTVWTSRIRDWLDGTED